jgi:cysteine desulfurase
MPRIYFDNSATTPVLPEVLEAMRPYFDERFGNASSIHRNGQETRAAVEQGRESVAALLGCRPPEVVFTSGGTEADNLAIFGVAGAGDHVITSAVEHHAVLNACRHLEAEGADVTYLPVDGRGLVDLADVRRALRPTTKLITVMTANNETGVLQPVEEIGKMDVASISCDLLSISGHKLHAPQGVGALYVRKGTALAPMLYGGRHERSRRAGTENVPGIVALGKAAELARAKLKNDNQGMARMRSRLEAALLALDSAGVNGEGAPRVPQTLSMYFDGIDGESLVIALDLKGLAVSTGAACSSGAIEPSHVLMAMGLSPDRARASVRFSLGRQNTMEEVEVAISLVAETVARLRELAPRKAAVSH